MNKQKVEGGVPVTRLTPSEIVTYYGAIVGSNTDGDLITWDGESNTFETFNARPNGTWDYSTHITEDLEGRDLVSVMEIAERVMG
jgi:hypothetical protein